MVGAMWQCICVARNALLVVRLPGPPECIFFRTIPAHRGGKWAYRVARFLQRSDFVYLDMWLPMR